ncbi:glycosyltransferase [uncultured Marinobacter sp.]|uniref:glycosyltransferase family 2 protein n=1 Tax=uncultured Marinobacter sp. TaxID=187379 RepID=UPI0025854ACA|nr:glycosyltransferase [uncultured Marinobacter sp.]
MTHESTQELPLVTFALFAYNQEKYIREAIEGAFAQTYEPLEIILSDDGSSDDTFNVMQEAAKNYSGPHRVIARQTNENRGTFNHVLEVAREMSGELMVLGAGDDISAPNRCNEIVSEWIRSPAKIFFSIYEKIDDVGKSLGVSESSGGQEITNWFAPEQRQHFNHGATTAYHSEVFRGLSFSEDPIFSEDALFYIISIVNGYEIRKLPFPLVKYRQSADSISNDMGDKTSKADIEGFEKKISWMAKSYVSLCDYALKLLDNIEGFERAKGRIKATHRFAMIRCGWIDSGLGERIRLALLCREMREVRFLLPRILGLNFFAQIKSWFATAKVRRVR